MFHLQLLTLPHCRYCCCRLLRALEEAKRRTAKAQKEKHAADLAAAELRGKAEAERDGQRMEVRGVCEAAICWI
jgi:hypothetical protein